MFAGHRLKTDLILKVLVIGRERPSAIKKLGKRYEQLVNRKQTIDAAKKY